MRRGNLIVISAPSGAGKTTIVKRILKEDEYVSFSISYTTRKMRDGEVDGKDYFFVDEETFKNMIDEDEFLEWAKVYGNYYGTSKTFVNKILEGGKDVLLDIDVQGARQVKEKDKDATLIFIIPPSFRELERRLRGRGTDSREVIEKRLKIAKSEIMEYKIYDFLVINDMLDEAVLNVRKIIDAMRFKRKNMSFYVEKILKEG